MKNEGQKLEHGENISPRAGYFFFSQINFIEFNKTFKKNFENKKYTEDDLTHQKFGIAQKVSLIWCPMAAILTYLPVFFDFMPEQRTKFIIIAIGFVIMPIFFLHIPDYLLCLPLWSYQLRKAKKIWKNSMLPMGIYDNSLLFKHEMLYFQLPELHKFILFFTKNDEIQTKEAMNRIVHLYFFSFQQEQAGKAITEFGENKERIHQFIHILLEKKLFRSIRHLFENNPIADFYISLFDNMEEAADNEELYEAVKENIEFIFEEYDEEDSRFHSEITETLIAAYKFLIAERLKDICRAISILENISDFSKEIKYFTDIQILLEHLLKIRNHLLIIESVEMVETRRMLLNEQKQILETLAKQTEEIFYEPFATIWQTALTRISHQIS